MQDSMLNKLQILGILSVLTLVSCQGNDQSSKTKDLVTHDAGNIDVVPTMLAFKASTGLASIPGVGAAKVIQMGLNMDAFAEPVAGVFQSFLDNHSYFDCHWQKLLSFGHYVCSIFASKDSFLAGEEIVGQSIITHNRINLCKLTNITVGRSDSFWDSVVDIYAPLAPQDYYDNLYRDSEALIALNAVSLKLERTNKGVGVASIESSLGEINAFDLREVNINNCVANDAPSAE